MPDKPLTIATYAAGASLAAITLVYVFGPTFFLDDDAAQSSRSSRKKGVVGLHNPANDCFMNSVLQTLAGLPELRFYLIRELHRRQLERDIYNAISKDEDDASQEKESGLAANMPEWKALGLQKGLVTGALKDVLDSLNERPIYKKTISAGAFINVLEQAFRTRINRTQQDAQEFLQLVTERLSDEYHAAKKVRRKASKRVLTDTASLENSSDTIGPTTAETTTTTRPPSHVEKPAQPPLIAQKKAAALEEEETLDPGFPFEGKISSQIECTHCHFKPKPTVSDFVTLTLHVPQQGRSTTLNACFDGLLKVEHIDDFRCEACRLSHAITTKQNLLTRTTSPSERQTLESEIQTLSTANPEDLPKSIPLPPIASAPVRKIARHTRISSFPRLLAIHLSRSVFDSSTSTTKNQSKVSFPETLPLGGILDRAQYRLLGVVTHKGGHNSGHYEAFRRQVLREPFSSPLSWGREGVYKASPPAGAVTPTTEAEVEVEVEKHELAPTKSAGSGSGSSIKAKMAGVRNATGRDRKEKDKEKLHQRWWRISDEKVKEAKTADVLGMQREVYLLFYELLPPAT